MSEYGGINMQLGKGGGMKKGKAAPRAGAAKGQGEGMGGYNGARVNKAMRACGMPGAKYYMQGSAPASAGK